MVAYGQGSATPIEDAVRWVEALMLGTLATTIAVIAVASVGFMMLTGRLQWRRGVTTLLGCFILFGAREIASGLQSAATGGLDGSIEQPAVYQPLPAPVIVPQPTPAPSQRPEVEL